MAPEKSQKDPYFSRLNALYQTLDEILHPMPEITVKKLPEEKFVISPDFALQIGLSQGEDKPPCVRQRDAFILKSSIRKNIRL